MSTPMRLKAIKYAPIVLAPLLLIGCITIFTPHAESVRVEANRPNVRIYLDGEYQGIAPVVIKVPRSGSHKLRVESEGFTTREVTLQKGLTVGAITQFTLAGVGNLAMLAATGDRLRIFSGVVRPRGFEPPTS